jgi:hypothetical protein
MCKGFHTDILKGLSVTGSPFYGIYRLVLPEVRLMMERQK